MLIKRSDLLKKLLILLSFFVLSSAGANGQSGRLYVGTCGDSNDDSSVNIADLTNFKKYLFENDYFPANVDLLNLNGCNGINVTDLCFLVEFLFNGGPPPSPNCESPSTCPPTNSGAITLDLVEGLFSVDTILTNQEIKFSIKINNSIGKDILGLSNGFRIYSPDGANWTTTTGSFAETITPAMLSQVFVSSFGTNGSDSDTIGFGGISFSLTGIPDGFSDTLWNIIIGPIEDTDHGKTICLDTSLYAPSNNWIWSTSGTDEFTPSWDGPHCFTIYSLAINNCCQLPGDFNHDGSLNIKDLTDHVAYQFKSGDEPPCLNDMDVNGDCDLNIKDLTDRVAFQFKSGPELICGCVE